MRFIEFAVGVWKVCTRCGGVGSEDGEQCPACGGAGGIDTGKI